MREWDGFCAAMDSNDFSKLPRHSALPLMLVSKCALSVTDPCASTCGPTLNSRSCSSESMPSLLWTSSTCPAQVGSARKTHLYSGARGRVADCLLICNVLTGAAEGVRWWLRMELNRVRQQLRKPRRQQIAAAAQR